MEQDILDYDIFLKNINTRLTPAYWHIVKCNSRRRIYNRTRPNFKDLPPELKIDVPDSCPTTFIQLNYNPLENLSYDAPTWGQDHITGDWCVVSRLTKVTNQADYHAIFRALTRKAVIVQRQPAPTKVEVREALGNRRAALLKSRHYLAGLS